MVIPYEHFIKKPNPSNPINISFAYSARTACRFPLLYIVFLNFLRLSNCFFSLVTSANTFDPRNLRFFVPLKTVWTKRISISLRIEKHIHRNTFFHCFMYGATLAMRLTSVMLSGIYLQCAYWILTYNQNLCQVVFHLKVILSNVQITSFEHIRFWLFKTGWHLSAFGFISLFKNQFTSFSPFPLKRYSICYVISNTNGVLSLHNQYR